MITLQIVFDKDGDAYHAQDGSPVMCPRVSWTDNFILCHKPCPYDIGVFTDKTVTCKCINCIEE